MRNNIKTLKSVSGDQSIADSESDYAVEDEVSINFEAEIIRHYPRRERQVPGVIPWGSIAL